MSDEPNNPPAPDTAATPKRAAKAANEKIKLKAAIEWDGELAVGEARYPVQAGVVEVPPWHVENAYQAGFRPV